MITVTIKANATRTNIAPGTRVSVVRSKLCNPEYPFMLASSEVAIFVHRDEYELATTKAAKALFGS